VDSVRVAARDKCEHDAIVGGDRGTVRRVGGDRRPADRDGGRGGRLAPAGALVEGSDERGAADGARCPAAEIRQRARADRNDDVVLCGRHLAADADVERVVVLVELGLGVKADFRVDRRPRGDRVAAEGVGRRIVRDGIRRAAAIRERLELERRAVADHYGIVGGRGQAGAAGCDRDGIERDRSVLDDDRASALDCQCGLRRE